jgi:ATP-dependent phosphofructokinase / diphosphate-dependent phosphofructokinase
VQKNVVIAQSGGPSPVINNSLRGVIDACKSFPSEFGQIYGAWHGIEGVLKEELLNLSAQPEKEIELLETTPAAGSIGTCRYKLKDKQARDFTRILDVFRAHNVGYFFYIGGNDSMDTACKVSEIAEEKGLDLVATGIPKTIDNDVGDSEFKLIDHTPGYGSVAKYWAYCVQNANEENAGSYPADPALIMQVMGRKIGFIPAAARLADPRREMPLQIYMPEAGLTIENLADNVNDELKKSRRCIVILSEGFDFGEINPRNDAFGHAQFGSGDQTVQQVVVSYLNSKGIKARGDARGQMAGTDQRSCIIYASTIDLNEAYKVGRYAVRIAVKNGTGWMSTILRKSGDKYNAKYSKVSLQKVANSERSFPVQWIAPSKIDVTDDFIKYAQPLIGESWVRVPLEKGLQRFTRFQPIFAEKKCPTYLPEAYSK